MIFKMFTVNIFLFNLRVTFRENGPYADEKLSIKELHKPEYPFSVCKHWERLSTFQFPAWFMFLEVWSFYLQKTDVHRRISTAQENLINYNQWIQKKTTHLTVKQTGCRTVFINFFYLNEGYEKVAWVLQQIFKTREFPPVTLIFSRTSFALSDTELLLTLTFSALLLN